MHGDSPQTAFKNIGKTQQMLNPKTPNASSEKMITIAIPKEAQGKVVFDKMFV